MPKTTTKQVKLGLRGIDGNAFVILGAFRRQAQREKWTEEEITTVTTKAKSGNYSHLLATIADHCVNPLGKYRG